MSMYPVIQKGKKALSNVFSSANKRGAEQIDVQKQYGPQVGLGYSMSGGTGNVARSLNTFLKNRNLPGQTITNAFAVRRENDPQYKTNVALSRGGQRITPLQQRQTVEAGMAPVMGMATPVTARKVPNIDKLTQREMVDFIDYVRLRQPKNLPTELGATRIAEGFGLRMPKTTAGLANEFDRVLTVLRQRR